MPARKNDKSRSKRSAPVKKLSRKSLQGGKGGFLVTGSSPSTVYKKAIVPNTTINWGDGSV